MTQTVESSELFDPKQNEEQFIVEDFRELSDRELRVVCESYLFHLLSDINRISFETGGTTFSLPAKPNNPLAALLSDSIHREPYLMDFLIRYCERFAVANNRLPTPKDLVGAVETFIVGRTLQQMGIGWLFDVDYMSVIVDFYRYARILAVFMSVTLAFLFGYWFFLEMEKCDIVTL